MKPRFSLSDLVASLIIDIFAMVEVSPRARSLLATKAQHPRLQPVYSLRQDQEIL
jgi:hypothetical protein